MVRLHDPSLSRFNFQVDASSGANTKQADTDNYKRDHVALPVSARSPSIYVVSRISS